MRTAKEFAWLGGLLGGEGYFSVRKYSPRIELNMTDRDTVERVATFLSVKIMGPYQTNKKEHKSTWRCGLSGTRLVFRYLGLRDIRIVCGRLHNGKFKYKRMLY